MGTVYTVGHGARTAEEFLSVLQEAGIEVLADVRRYPGSRRHPHFGREALAANLSQAGIEYQWWGASMGGRRKADPASDARHSAWRVEAFRAYASHMETPDFREALSRLIDLSEQRRLAVMCSEALWWRCHRRLIADAVVAAGSEAVHIGRGAPQTHELTEFARIEAGTLLYDNAESPNLS
ncbi:MAG TPA: DUF488 domain-containing protein [Actinomycetota bacterium]|nr:DUF488 domain-containing protein [Actinomycetota bacterium]